MSAPPSVSPSSSSADLLTTSASSSRNPKNLSIPSSSLSSTTNPSPTTPTNAAAAATPVYSRSVANFDKYRLASDNAPAADAPLSQDEKALQNLTAADVHNPKASSSTMGSASEQSAMDQVLSGILTMQKEVSSQLDVMFGLKPAISIH